jgi:hypothetical protein
MDHCSKATVGRLDHAYWRGPPAAAEEEEAKKTWPPKFLRPCSRPRRSRLNRFQSKYHTFGQRMKLNIYLHTESVVL